MASVWVFISRQISRISLPIVLLLETPEEKKSADKMRIWFLLLCLLEWVILRAAVCATSKKPHIVFMIVDDLGWNDVSFHGSKQIPTPNIDAIARDGIILNQYYVQPICSPSRGSLMTGKYPIRIGFQHEVIKAFQPWGLPLKEKILPEYMKQLKYSTHAIGKWHLGFFKEEYLPKERGFDSHFGYYNGVEDYFTHFSEDKDTSGLDLHDNEVNAWQYNGTYGTDLFTAKAKKVIMEHNPTKPLFLYFAQQAPHSGNFKNPLQCPDKYLKPMVGIDDEKRKIFSGMVSSMDHSVGEIFGALEKSGLLDNTIFVFTTDNGGITQETGEASGSNWPLKGTKYNLWEGGIRATGFVWSPCLRRRSRIHNDLVHISDWLPTILAAAGGPDAVKLLPPDVDGVNQWPSISHGVPSARSEILLNIDDTEGVEGIRKGRYKMVKGSYYNGTLDHWYDQEGRKYNVTYSVRTPREEAIYRINYLRFLRRSKAARVLWRKYGRDPRLAYACLTTACKEQLEVRCGVPPPSRSTCDAKDKEVCVFDVVRDPCEYYNIAEQLPEVTADLLMTTDKYRKFAITPGGKKSDPKADPKLHGDAWTPWIQ